MASQPTLYIGVEGVLLREIADDAVDPGALEMVPGAEAFLKWAALRFECRWVTPLNADGGDAQIRNAFSRAVGASWVPEDLDLLFELVRPTYWEETMVEGIDLDSDFYWIAADLDAPSREGLRRRGLLGRLKIIAAEKGVDEFARLQLELDLP